MPSMVCLIVCYGWMAGCPVFDTFVRGAKRGLKTVVEILPVLIGLMAGVRILRDSGLLELLAGILAPVGSLFGIPAQILPLILVKLFSASAASGILLDLFKTEGPDSYIGILAAVISSSSETVLFVMSVYLTHVGIKKSRWILPAALFSTMAGVLAALWISGRMVP